MFELIHTLITAALALLAPTVVYEAPPQRVAAPVVYEDEATDWDCRLHGNGICEAVVFTSEYFIDINGVVFDPATGEILSCVAAAPCNTPIGD
jgi:hypothetical protein